MTLLSAGDAAATAQLAGDHHDARVLAIVGFLVLLPLVFLVEESLNVGDPMAFPPVEFGIANYLSIFDEDINVLVNTVSSR